ncbi:hypothetical protein [Zunongwangia sp. HGR-M22]|uniref:hypothetical protein n=1 Tax=Zunongwangia sp. HGR-M22 TaxID=3015168 RepID=UPI0022DD3018|nr:hypothetical protein [Zunongwangia sp. HGR-M22]WBL25101.1 hypothetical protein PBT91_14505 [Zunongwangia sp. HGR-M22]
MELSKKNILIGTIVVIIIWALSGLLIDLFTSKRGTFGDMFGAINALFSGLALFGIIVSIMIQQNELRLQREELQETRKEFVSNRTTSILFKQIEYLNTRIEKYKFLSDPFTDFRPASFSEFHSIISEYKERGESEIVNNLIDHNKKTFISIVELIVRSYKSFDKFLDFNNTEKEEQIQLRQFLKNNINPDTQKILSIRIKFLHEELNQMKNNTDAKDDLMIQFLKDLIKSEVDDINYIFNYGK